MKWATIALAAVFAGCVAFVGARIDGGGSAAPPIVETAPLLTLRRVPEAARDAASLVPLAAGVRSAAENAPGRVCVDVRTRGGFEAATFGTVEPLVIASNTKLFVTAAALLALGPEATFRTRVVAARKGTDAGTLFLVGGGDPFLSTEAFREWERSVGADRPATSLELLADAVARSGIKRVDGVVGDGGIFSGPAYLATHAPELLAQKVIPPLGGLSVNRNLASWRPGDKYNFRFVEDPARHGAAEFARLLDERGIRVGGTPRAGRAPADGTELASIESAGMAEIVKEINEESDNFAAEMLLRLLGSRGGNGSTAAGIAYVNDTLEAAGVPPEGSRLVDGSGLSRENVATCEKLGKLLSRMSDSDVFRASLPVAGETGTLERRYTAEARGRVFAKTGSLAEVSALAGYAATSPEMIFSVLVNEERSERARLAVEESVVREVLRYPALTRPVPV